MAAKRREERGERRENSSKGKKKATPTSEGYRKLFVNLGKKDGFYPGELMQFLNKYVHGHVAVGHIDLLQTMSYFEVPEEDAERVIKYVNGQTYKRREVRCNDASEGGKPAPRKSKETSHTNRTSNTRKPRENKTYKKDEWMQFLNPKSMKVRNSESHHARMNGRVATELDNVKLKGEIPDFSEEGWAIRKPRKKK